jgi:hypothetical protein
MNLTRPFKGNNILDESSGSALDVIALEKLRANVIRM